MTITKTKWIRRTGIVLVQVRKENINVGTVVCVQQTKYDLEFLRQFLK